MIKAVFFDLDGVLTLNRSALENTCRYLHKYTKIPLNRLRDCYKKYDPLLDLGKILHKDMWSDFCRCIGQDIKIKILENAFKSTPKNKRMLELVKRLKKNSYKVGIISDSGRERFNILAAKFKLNEVFDSWVLPYQVNSTKSKKEIFGKALKPLDIKPEESIFIDNRKHNLRAPKEIGMHAIYHNDKRNDVVTLIKKLKKLGVKV